jgi:thiamine pyrophosphate-dependent acetolactate synthase large subunit-like protein
MAKMTAGRAVVEALIAQGVDTVFGIISIHTLHIYDALREAVDEGHIRFVGARHEHALGFMADGYARATGKPGVMITSGGPGAADSIGAMGESYHSSVPILQITAEIESEWLGQGRGVTHEAVDQMAMFAPVTGWSALAESPQDVPNKIAAAFDHLRTQHPRPAVLAIPTDYLGQEADFEIIPVREPTFATPGASALAAAAAIVRDAKRPLIIAGGGVMRSGATDALRAFAERFDVPVAVADGGKGAFADDHPLGLGTVLGGRVWLDNPVQDYAGTCDAVVIVGTSMPFRSTKGVALQLPENTVQIDLDASMFGRNYPVKVGLAGDARQVIEALAAAIGEPRVSADDAHAALAQVKLDARASLERQMPNELRMWEAVRAAIDRDAVVLADSTIAGYAATRCFPTYEPLTFHHPHGWVSIGYAFAASLGAKVGLPDRQVICVTGDGGFQYNIQELASAQQHGIAPVVLLFNDNAWGVLERYQKTAFDGRTFATSLVNPDFRQLSAAYGVGYHLARDVDELASALAATRNPERLQVIEVAIPDGVAGFA